MTWFLDPPDVRQSWKPYPSYLASGKKRHSVVILVRRIKKNIPVRGIQTTPRTTYVDHQLRDILSYLILEKVGPAAGCRIPLFGREMAKGGRLRLRGHGLGRFACLSLALIAASILLLSISHLLTI